MNSHVSHSNASDLKTSVCEDQHRSGTGEPLTDHLWTWWTIDRSPFEPSSVQTAFYDFLCFWDSVASDLNVSDVCHWSSATILAWAMTKLFKLYSFGLVTIKIAELFKNNMTCMKKYEKSRKQKSHARSGCQNKLRLGIKTGRFAAEYLTRSPVRGSSVAGAQKKFGHSGLSR